MSAPAMKAPPLPSMTNTRQPRSPATARSTSCNARVVDRVRALRVSGRVKRSRATPSDVLNSNPGFIYVVRTG